MESLISMIEAHSFFTILLYAVCLDTVLGVLRAVKERKFNSCVGIDGAIRKVAMLFSVVLLMYVNALVSINFLFMVPEQYLSYIGINELGICELFCMLFVLYELVSILKNMTLCGLPVPAKLRQFLMQFLDGMTDELPEEVAEALHNETEGE